MPTQVYKLKNGQWNCPYCKAGPFYLLGKHARYCKLWPKNSQWCKRCETVKPLSEFYHNYSRTKERASMCKACNVEWGKEQWKNHPERYLRLARQTARRLKIIIMEKYGGSPAACSCCGETDMDVLCLDHINGDGRKHRREIEGKSLYAWIRREGYPPIFQVLCANCNMSKSLGPACRMNHGKNVSPSQRSVLCQPKFIV